MNTNFFKYCSWFCRLFCLWILVFPITAGALDPDFDYYTLKTRNFNIHYHKEIEPTARQAASIFESVYEEITQSLKWQTSKTEVFLVDDRDSANGFAMASPRPLIHIYATPPSMDSELIAHDLYLRTVFTHEFTHVTHLQMQKGLSKVINSVFGDVYLLNQMQPKWFIEGLSVYQESTKTTSGRNRSAAYYMAIRTDALEGRFLSLGKLSNNFTAFPRGHAWYNYGGMFVGYIAQRFGEDKVAQICHAYSGEIIPYGLNRVFKKVLGIGLFKVYDDWQKEVLEKSLAIKKRLEKEGLTQTRRLTTDGEVKGRPLFGPDDRHLYLPIGNSRDRTGIYELALDGTASFDARDRKLIAYSGSVSRVSFDANGRLFFARSAPHKNIYQFMDVFVLDNINAAEPKRVTHGRRSREAAVSNRGDKLALVVLKSGLTRLDITDDRGNYLKTLIPPQTDHQVYDPAWSPDGNEIAVIERIKDKICLVLIDVNSGKKTYITRDRVLDSMPIYDATGKYVLFSSDRSGISNIYAFDKENKVVRRLTNVLTGAKKPAVSHDGKTLAFLKYHADGWDVHITDFHPQQGQEVAISLEEPDTKLPDYPPVSDTPEQYNPLPSFLPRAWRLSFSLNDDKPLLNATVAMSDAVRLHSAAANVYWNIKDEKISFSTGYAYKGLITPLRIGFSRVVADKTEGYSPDGIEAPWKQTVIESNVGFSIPFRGMDRSHSLYFDYNTVYARPTEKLQTDDDPAGELPQVPRQYFRAGLSVGWSFNEDRGSSFGISTEEGRSISLQASVYHPALASTQKLASFKYGWREYIEAPWLDHHVFAFYLKGKINVSSPPERSSSSVGGYQEQNYVDAIRKQANMGIPSLRGYAPGSFSGDQYHSLRFEYRFPIWAPDVGYKTVPIFFRRVHGAFFTDNVVISYDQLDRDDWRSSVGGELVWSFYLGYYQPLKLRTGYARGLMDKGINEFILVIGGTF